MAKKKGRKVGTNKSPGESETMSEESVQDVSDTTEEQGVWDLVRVLSPQPFSQESNTVVTPTECRMDGCEKAAIVVWAESLRLEDEWPLCEGCQEKEFGGWPEGITAPTTSTNNDVEPTNPDPKTSQESTALEGPDKESTE